MELSEYERQRIENIRKNEEHIESLGLNVAKSALHPQSLPTTASHKEKTKNIERKPVSVTNRNAESKRKREKPVRLSEELELENSNEAVNRPIKRKKIDIYPKQEAIPNRDTNDCLYFPDFPQFRPNLTPKQIMQMGSFGGTYFRVIKSGVTGETYHNAWKEFPSDWFEGLNIEKWVSSQNYNESINTYKVSCGGDLYMWESSGWITEVDPFGWFQWYCRFYLGRRCADDERQVGRALGVMGPKGRWRSNLVKKVLSINSLLEKVVDDVSVSPKVRQLLQHWGYKLTLKDLQAAKKML